MPTSRSCARASAATLYQAALDRLLAQGARLRLPLQPQRPGRQTAASTDAAWPAPPRADPAIRLRVPDGTAVDFDDAIQGRSAQDVAREVGDFVLRRADGYWAYQLAVVVDDAAQGITDVVRGADLLDSTPRQILLQRALGLPTPRYAHLPLVRGRAGPQAVQVAARRCRWIPADPLPALRAAWRALGQARRAAPAPRRAARCWTAAQRGFDPARIPRPGRVRHRRSAQCHRHCRDRAI